MMLEKIIQKTTCFNEHSKRQLECNKAACRNWMPCPSKLNCAVIGAANETEHTLQEIGNIFGVTRMRICQIEKVLLSDISSNADIKMTR